MVVLVTIRTQLMTHWIGDFVLMTEVAFYIPVFPDQLEIGFVMVEATAGFDSMKP